MSFLLFTAACNKFETVKHFTINPSVKSFFQYKTGSTWEYVLETDSTKKAVTTVLNYREGKMVWDAFTQDFFEYDLVSPLDSLIKLRAIADENNISWTNFLYRDTTYKVALQWFNVNGNFTAVNGTGDTLNLLSSKMVKGVTYNSVMELAPARKTLFRKVWIAQNVGIIQKQLKNGDMYMLKTYSLQ